MLFVIAHLWVVWLLFAGYFASMRFIFLERFARAAAEFSPTLTPAAVKRTTTFWLIAHLAMLVLAVVLRLNGI